jgi:hypothetical protein
MGEEGGPDERCDVGHHEPLLEIRQRKKRVNYICVANGITIATYGWLALSLNLGLRRDFDVAVFVLFDRVTRARTSFTFVPGGPRKSVLGMQAVYLVLSDCCKRFETRALCRGTFKRDH